MSDVRTISIAHLIRERAKTAPDFDVLTFEDNGRTETRTYKQLWDNGLRLAAALKSLGVARGDRFGGLLQNHPEFVEALVASAILGTIFVPIDPRTRGDKLAYMLADAKCVGAICGDYAADALLDCVDTLADFRWVMVVGDHLPAPPSSRLALGLVRHDLSQPVPDLPIAVTDPSEPMQIMYSSGTTGDPKGIVVRHARFAMVASHGESVFGYRADDRLYTGLSLTHGNAQFGTLAPALKMGLRAVISRKFTKSRLWDIVRRHGCTSFTLLGGMVTGIYSEPPSPDDANNPVRLVVSAGMPKAIWKDFATRFGVDICEFYGAVEGGMTVNPPGQGPEGSCGRVVPGLVAKVVDEDGNEVPPGTPGEIWFRPADGSPASVEYYNNPEASCKKTEGGWLHSGDVVSMDENGWVFFQFRKGGGIRRNGDFINPAIVEKVIAEHPNVDDVHVFGIPTETGAPGENDVVAAVVANGLDVQDLFKHCRTRLDAMSVPTFIMIVDELPKTASQKVQPRFLIEAFKTKTHPIHRGG